jgi:osmotically-inducible protein OsmY
MRHPLRFLPYLPLLLAFVSASAVAQDKTQTTTARLSSCSRDNALSIIQRQIDLSKTIDQDERRINVLLKAADLTWPLEQSQARATFTDAFDVATRQFKEKGEKDTNEGRSRVQGIDYRYTVITAIAKRDSAWARRLTKQILDEEADAADKTQKDSAQAARTAEKLLSTALSMVGSDQTAALEFARSSLRYPSTFYLPLFLFKMWEANHALADQFYGEALTAYAQTPMDQFLYLSSYPFGATREIGEMPVSTFYQVPVGFAPNPSLERMFVLALLSHARESIQNPDAAKSGSRFSDNTQVFMALSRLEPLVANSLPDLAPQLAEAKGNIASLLTQPEQQRASDTLTDPPKRSFDETIERGDRSADAAQREAVIAIAVLNAAETESLEKLEAASLKIDDVELRKQIMSLVYFYRSQKLIKEKKLDEARKLAAKVEEPDQRAYLYAQIATESLKQTRNDTAVREMLEDVLQAVAKAPNSEVKVRAMLVVVHIYSTIDPNRAVALLGEVVTTINRVELVELSSDRISKRVEGKAFGTYRLLATPGFSPEIVFREMGKLDFDGTLYVASNLSDKSLRALTSLSLADQCIKDLPPPPKPTPNKPAAPKP